DAVARRHVGADAAIVAGQRARPHVRGRRNHRPDHDAVTVESDVDAEFLDLAAVAVDPLHAGRPIEAADVARGAEDEADGPGHLAIQIAGLDAALRLRSADNERRRSDSCSKAKTPALRHRYPSSVGSGDVSIR